MMSHTGHTWHLGVILPTPGHHTHRGQRARYAHKLSLEKSSLEVEVGCLAGGGRGACGGLWGGGASWRCGCGAGMGRRRSSRRASRWGEGVWSKIHRLQKRPAKKTRCAKITPASRGTRALRSPRHHSRSQADARLSERHQGDSDPDTAPIKWDSQHRAHSQMTSPKSQTSGPESQCPPRTRPLGPATDGFTLPFVGARLSTEFRPRSRLSGAAVRRINGCILIYPSRLMFPVAGNGFISSVITGNFPVI